MIIIDSSSVSLFLLYDEVFAVLFVFFCNRPRKKTMEMRVTVHWAPAPHLGQTSTTSSICLCGASLKRRWRIY